MSLLNGMKNATNIAYTENGARAYATTKSAIVDFFAQAGAMRKRSDQDIIDLFNKAYAEDNLVALKLLFYFRNCRGGAGERRLFNVVINYLSNFKPEIIQKNIENIVEFGRWDDLYSLFHTSCENDAIQLFRTQINKDLTSETPSLCAKWMKSENTSSVNSVLLAKRFIDKTFIKPRHYRKTLSHLRGKIRIIENNLRTKDYASIDYSKISSKAGFKYKAAFWRNDEDRYRSFIGQVQKGEKKINAKTLFPYEIVRDALSCYNWNGSLSGTQKALSLDAMWKALPDYIGENKSNVLCVIDTSASMLGLPMESAIALGIYFAERNKGIFANHFISFASRPQLIQITGDDITSKAYSIRSKSLIDDTNIEAVFDLILNTAIRNNLPIDEIPERIVIISDMEFNQATTHRGSDEVLFETIRRKWDNTIYKLPKLTYWNVDARAERFPMTADERGVQFVSGHSPSIFTSILKDKFVQPIDMVLDIVNNPIYDVIKL